MVHSDKECMRATKVFSFCSPFNYVTIIQFLALLDTATQLLKKLIFHSKKGALFSARGPKSCQGGIMPPVNYATGNIHHTRAGLRGAYTEPDYALPCKSTATNLISHNIERCRVVKMSQTIFWRPPLGRKFGLRTSTNIFCQKSCIQPNTFRAR